MTIVQIVLGLAVLGLAFSLFASEVQSKKWSLTGLVPILIFGVASILFGCSLAPRLAPLFGEDFTKAAPIEPPDAGKNDVKFELASRTISFGKAPDGLKWMVQAEGQGPTVVLNNTYVVPAGSNYALVYFQRDKPFATASGAIIVTTR